MELYPFLSFKRGINLLTEAFIEALRYFFFFQAELSEEWSKSTDPSAASSSVQSPEHNSRETPSQESQQDFIIQSHNSSKPGFFQQPETGVVQQEAAKASTDIGQDSEQPSSYITQDWTNQAQSNTQNVDLNNEYGANTDGNYGQWNGNEQGTSQQNEMNYQQYEPAAEMDYPDGSVQNQDFSQDQQSEWNQSQSLYNQQMYNPDMMMQQYNPEQSTQNYGFDGYYPDQQNQAPTNDSKMFC